MKKYCNLFLFCLFSLCFFGCKEDKKEVRRDAKNEVSRNVEKEDKKILYIKCGQFENTKCLSGHTLEESCAGKDENGNVYIEVDNEQIGMGESGRSRIYKFRNLWFFRVDFGFDDGSGKTHVLKTTAEAGEDESKTFIGGNKSCVCGEGKKIPGGAACKTVLTDGYCYVNLGNGIVEMQGYDVFGDVFSRINAAFGDQNRDRLVTFFPNSRGDMIYHTYINDRFNEYKEAVITLFNTIKLGIVLAKNADEFKEYINKAADRFDEYYKLETENYTYGLHEDEQKMKEFYDKELKRIAKVRKELLEIVDSYKDVLFMTEAEFAQNKIRKMNSFGERDPEMDECGRYSL